jgi:hypothetical protein
LAGKEEKKMKQAKKLVSEVETAEFTQTAL